MLDEFLAGTHALSLLKDLEPPADVCWLDVSDAYIASEMGPHLATHHMVIRVLIGLLVRHEQEVEDQNGSTV